MENKKYLWQKFAGLSGAVLWALTIFLRGTEISQIVAINFLLGILPNFSVGLLLPMLVGVIYPVIFKKDLSIAKYRCLLGLIFLLLVLFEVTHAVFLNSKFDKFDIVASLIALVIMSFLY